MKIIAELVTKKIVRSGNIVEIYNYSKGYLKDFEVISGGSGGRVADFKSDNYQEHRKQVLSRAKRDLRRLINSNVGMYGADMTSKFLTLTFSKNITDLETANYEFKKFIKRLNYSIFKTKKAILKYNVVIEFQDRGAIHYHLIIYNMPFTKQKLLQEIWDNGIVDIRKIDQVDNVGAYIAEYLGDPGKEQGKGVEDSRLEGKKSYFSSRGLFKPIEITDKKKVEAVATALPINKMTFSSLFNNEHLGDISYKQYNLNTLKNKGDLYEK